jgi:hypothetical protein
MKNLKTFESFEKVNEGTTGLERAQNLLESDLLKQPFMKKIIGDKTPDQMGWGTDYDLDDDNYMTSIEIKNLTPELVKSVDYETLGKEFEEWATKHRFYSSEITSSEENDSITFTVEYKMGPHTYGGRV